VREKAIQFFPQEKVPIDNRSHVDRRRRIHSLTLDDLNIGVLARVSLGNGGRCVLGFELRWAQNIAQTFCCSVSYIYLNLE
jgi:hypothetical protein